MRWFSLPSLVRTRSHSVSVSSLQAIWSSGTYGYSQRRCLYDGYVASSISLETNQAGLFSRMRMFRFASISVSSRLIISHSLILIHASFTSSSLTKNSHFFVHLRDSFLVNSSSELKYLSNLMKKKLKIESKTWKVCCWSSIYFLKKKKTLSLIE